MPQATMFNPSEPACLSNLCNGELEQIFQAEVPALLSQLQQGQKAKLTIELVFAKVKDTDTMISITANAKPSFPPRTKTAVGQITGDFKLKVDRPTTKVTQLSLAEKPGAAE